MLKLLFKDFEEDAMSFQKKSTITNKLSLHKAVVFSSLFLQVVCMELISFF